MLHLNRTPEQIHPKKYKAYTLRNFRDIPQMDLVPETIKRDIEVVGQVLPFKANNYVIDELINWENIPEDPLFTLIFPRRELLSPKHYNEVSKLMEDEASATEIGQVIHRIRQDLNPHPAGQSHNVPKLHGKPLPGIQHKYEQTVLFFPQQGQTCHAYCSFCFRWPQFVGLDEERFAMKDAGALVDYIRAHPKVTNILFTGGDPMVMSSKILRIYIEALLNAGIPHLRSIRIGSKSLSYWPYKFVNEKDTENILELFRSISEAGLHLAFMAHFNHPRELSTIVVQEAIKNIRATGAEIRSQSPLLNHINNSPRIWEKMWKLQVQLGIIPYYMFQVRDTGAQEFYGISLVEAHRIFHEAYRNISGLARTVRGPSMSADPGKIQVYGVTEINGEKVMALSMIQGRKKHWVGEPFFAKYDPDAIWIDDLEPAFDNDAFFYEEELEQIYAEESASSGSSSS